jgi:multisubunit Na+/H+ antiporter MnhB subunit
VFLGFTVYAFGALPEFGNPGARLSDTYLVSGPERTGATNIVTAILLDFRAYDTLGEATVILAAVLGVLVVLRKLPRKEERPEPEPETDEAGEPELAEVTHA